MKSNIFLGLSILMSLFVGTMPFQCHHSISLTSEEAKKIGMQIWFNEAGQKVEGLTCWNKGEEFASLGIGHFIWYPEGVTGSFKQIFPDFLVFLKQEGISLPEWIEQASGCPWRSREEFYQNKEDKRIEELRQLLIKTIDKQLIYMIKRLDRAFPAILQHVAVDKKERITMQFYRLAQTSAGLYALIDYINFKGEGLAEQENYQGKRWGLKQVLEQMAPDSDDPLKEFVRVAKELLAQRVEFSPSERHEQRWLKGWYNRLDTYLSFGI